MEARRTIGPQNPPATATAVGRGRRELGVDTAGLLMEAGVELGDAGYEGLRARVEAEIGSRTKSARARAARRRYSFDEDIPVLMDALEKARERYFARPLAERIRFEGGGERVDLRPPEVPRGTTRPDRSPGPGLGSFRERLRRRRRDRRRRRLRHARRKLARRLAALVPSAPAEVDARWPAPVPATPKRRVATFGRFAEESRRCGILAGEEGVEIIPVELHLVDRKPSSDPRVFDKVAFPIRLDTSRWAPLPYGERFRDARFPWSRPNCVVCSKTSEEDYLGGPRVNSIETDLLLEIAGRLRTRYQVVCDRPRSVNIVNDHQRVGETGDIEALQSHHPDVLTIRELHARYPELSFNELQLRVFAGCRHFASAVGGGAYLPSWFGGTNVVCARGGREVECGAFESWFGAFSGAKVTPVSSPEQLLAAVDRELLGNALPERSPAIPAVAVP